MLKWLTDPTQMGLVNAHQIPMTDPLRRAPSPAVARRVYVEEIGDALVPISGEFGDRISVYRVYERIPSLNPPSLQLRSGLAIRLGQASHSLPPGYTLAVIDGWRSLRFQRELVEYYQPLYESLEGFVSDPDDASLLAPHITGGAVDLTLAYNHVPLALGTDFDDFSDRSHVRWFESAVNQGGASRDEDGNPAMIAGLLRRLLAHSLVAVGLAPLDTEWWHWSFGDQRWAAFHGRSKSLYGLIEEKT